MKAEELMIGDWVSFPDLGKTLFVTIVGIEQREGLGRIGYTFILRDEQKRTLYVSRQSVKPIPLTPEILEKNGWTYNDVDKVFYPAQLRGELPYIVRMNGVFRVRDFCEIRYVHELQHAIRLCGIKKEIKL